MPMGIGLWYNPRTDKVFNVGTFGTHDDWLKKEENAVALGLRPETIKLISGLSSDPDSVDLIRTAAVQDGMVRIRDYNNRISVQFQARRGVRDLLFKLHKLLANYFGPYSYVTINNMTTGESTGLSIQDMGQRLSDDTPILFREGSDDFVMDIPSGPVIGRIIEEKLNSLRAKLAGS